MIKWIYQLSAEVLPQHRLDEHRDTCLEMLVDTRCKLADSLDLVPQLRVLQLFLLMFGKAIPSDFQKQLDTDAISGIDSRWSVATTGFKSGPSYGVCIDSVECRRVVYGSVFGQSSTIRAESYG